jgi:hypothetical protein
MKNKYFHILILSLVSILFSSTSFGKDYQVANPSNYSNNVNVYSFNNIVPQCCVLDNYYFSVNNTSNINIDFSYQLGYAMFPEAGSIALYDNAPSFSTIVASDSFDAIKNIASIHVVNAVAGSYMLSSYVSQIPVVDSAFNYSITISSVPVTPAPEPGEWLLMLLGLGMIGFISKRRSSQEAILNFA